MNTREFADYVGASEQVTRRWLRSGKLPGVRRDGAGRWVVDAPEIAAAAWRARADFSKASPEVITRALATGRAPRARSAKPRSSPPRAMRPGYPNELEALRMKPIVASARSRNGAFAATRGPGERVVVAFESAHGRLEVDEATWLELLDAGNTPNDDLLTPRLVAILDGIMFVTYGGDPGDLERAVAALGPNDAEPKVPPAAPTQETYDEH